jgi:proteasome lid subunit RPN8/RPN11
MSFFNNLFGSAQPQQPAPAPAPAPAAQQQQSQAAPPGNIPAQPNNGTQQSANTAPNGVVPEQPAQPESPLDQFKDIWQPVENQSDPNAPLLNVDPKKLAEASRKTNFAGMINPQLMEQIQQGGPEATKAFAAAMNQVAQGVYAQSAFATSKIVEAAVSKAKQQLIAEMPQQFKRQQVSDTLRSENPVFNHPAASPILSAVERQLSMKFPNAPASEISGMAKQYLQNFAGAISPQQVQESRTAGKRDEDWSNFA